VTLLAIVGLFGIGYYAESTVKPWKAEDIASLHQEDVNSFDRSATSNWSKSAGNLSDMTLMSCTVSPALLLFGPAIRKDILTVGVMYVEAMGITNALTSAAKGFAKRSRPYTYNSGVPLNEKLAADSRKSFFSGHTSNAFASTVFLSAVYSDYFPGSKWKAPVWGISLSAAALTGYLRYRAGKHFPTDILTGAAIGSAAGYFVPYFHRHNDGPAPLSLSCSGDVPQISLVRNF
jgi:membrane-associated phospholipid phosphatase